MAEGEAVPLPVSNPADFLNGLEDHYRKATKPPQIILMNFPHNPTTACVDLDFFKEVIRMAHQHGTMVVHDFAYADLGFDGYRAPSILQVEGPRTSLSRSSPCRRATTWQAGESASASATRR